MFSIYYTDAYTVYLKKRKKLGQLCNYGPYIKWIVEVPLAQSYLAPSQL